MVGCEQQEPQDKGEVGEPAHIHDCSVTWKRVPGDENSTPSQGSTILLPSPPTCRAEARISQNGQAGNQNTESG